MFHFATLDWLFVIGRWEFINHSSPITDHLLPMIHFSSDIWEPRFQMERRMRSVKVFPLPETSILTVCVNLNLLLIPPLSKNNLSEWWFVAAWNYILTNSCERSPLVPAIVDTPLSQFRYR